MSSPLSKCSRLTTGHTLRAFLLVVATVAGTVICSSECRSDESSQSKTASEKYTLALNEYLSRSFDGRIEFIKADDATLSVEGILPPSGGQYLLSSSPMHHTILDPFNSDWTMNIERDASGAFNVTLPRFVPSQTNGNDPSQIDDATDSATGLVDRALHRWYILSSDTDGNHSLASTARYVDEIACAQPMLPKHELKSKKGLGGWTPKRGPGLDGELDELQISAVTVNVGGLHHFLSLEPSGNSTPYPWQGYLFYLDESRLKHFDEVFLAAQKNNVMVSAILLIALGGEGASAERKLLAHPDATTDGHYAMPNILDAKGIAFYGAILNLMAERWSREDGKFGRVHHWILHNEVDFGWIWTNAGNKSDVEYMDMYHRSMRLVHLIARKFDPNATAFISLTHHWSDPGEPYAYGSRRMLELLLQFCKAEGDFEWGLAHHPYPADLFEPRTWEDASATRDWETKKITPKNLEVLDAYMQQDALKYKGKTRIVHLSENGFNSRDYSDKALADQAAGMALAWKKIENLQSIQLWHYHNWIDHPDEGGLRIGLRKFPRDPDDPFGKKNIWNLYRALGTPEEEAAAAPYLKTIGIEDWSEIQHPFP